MGMKSRIEQIYNLNPQPKKPQAIPHHRIPKVRHQYETSGSIHCPRHPQYTIDFIVHVDMTQPVMFFEPEFLVTCSNNGLCDDCPKLTLMDLSFDTIEKNVQNQDERKRGRDEKIKGLMKSDEFLGICWDYYSWTMEESEGTSRKTRLEINEWDEALLTKYKNFLSKIVSEVESDLKELQKQR